MRRGPIIRAASAVAVALGACVAAPHPPLVLPAAPSDKARLVVYCDNNPYTDPSWTTVSLDGKRLGGIGPGNVFYRDLMPGSYEIAVRSEQLYPNQERTLSLAAGTTTYIDVQAVLGWGKSEDKPTRPFSLVIVDPRSAERAIAPLRLTQG